MCVCVCVWVKTIKAVGRKTEKKAPTRLLLSLFDW